MRKSMWIAGSALMALLVNGVQAQDFPVTGTGAGGHAGATVFVKLDYDYGAGLGIVAEDLQFAYQSPGIMFDRAASTIGPLGGSSQPFANYVASLQSYAIAHSGSLAENLNPGGLPPGYGSGYALSFQVPTGADVRTGIVELKLAFDIAPSALPGSSYDVSFAPPELVNGLATDTAEFTYPVAMQHLAVQVVPEPEVAWMLLPGLALVGLYARRRAAR